MNDFTHSGGFVAIICVRDLTRATEGSAFSLAMKNAGDSFLAPS